MNRPSFFASLIVIALWFAVIMFMAREAYKSVEGLNLKFKLSEEGLDGSP